MDILFDGKLGDLFNSQKQLRRAHGEARTKLIARRLDQLRAAPSLLTMRSLPGRLHELRGDRSGVLSINLDGPYRLLMEPANDPVPRLADGGLDWSRVTAICIVGVEDTHD